MSKERGVDKVFLSLTIALVIIGFTVFVSASLGILATSSSAAFGSIAFKQAFFGILLGLLACFFLSKVRYVFFKKYAFFLFLASLLLMCAVFLPGIGAKINGARRWIMLFGLSFQPVALLNIAFVAYFAAWLSYVKEKAATLRHGLAPLTLMLGVMGILLLAQPDTDSFLILCTAGVGMLLVAGGQFRHVFFLGLVGIIGIAVIALARPYVMSRIHTFFNPADNALTSGYQVQQSLIAIGSGGFFGRGLGQSIQKYKFLPESVSDSIFAVLGEELGFVGAAGVIILFLFFIFRGFRIAVRAPDAFSGLFVVGIVIIISVQSFINIGSTLGVVPFSGIPLAFFSQGGTAMLMTLVEIGIILNISRFTKQ